MAKKATKRAPRSKSSGAATDNTICTVHRIGKLEFTSLEAAQAHLEEQQAQQEQEALIKGLLGLASPRYAKAFRPAYEQLAKVFVGDPDRVRALFTGGISKAPADAPPAASPAPKARKPRKPRKAEDPPAPSESPAPKSLEGLQPPPPPPPA